MRSYRESLPMLLLRSREAVMDYFLPTLKAHSLTEQQWRVIRALNELKECNAQDLAKASCILSPSLSRILNYLLKEALIIKSASDTDNRAYVLKLSKKGAALHEEVGSIIEDKYRLLQQALCPEKLEQLYQILHEVSELKN